MADKVTDNEIIEALELFKNIDDNDITTASFKTKLLKEIYFLINRLKAENDDLFYKLQGVMLSVDKWLDGDELKQDEVNRAATMREKTLQIKEQKQAEIERLTTEIDQKTEMMANLGVKLISYEEENERLKTDLQAMRSAANSLKMHLWKYQDIESTVDEFWVGLQKMSMFKGKDKPTLEELLEYIEQKDEEIRRLQKDKSDIISAVEYRINQAKEFAYKEFAERLKERSIDIDVSYGYGKEHHTEAVTVIEIDNLLAELTPEPLTKIDHSSLCETETHEGDLKG